MSLDGWVRFHFVTSHLEFRSQEYWAIATFCNRTRDGSLERRQDAVGIVEEDALQVHAERARVRGIEHAFLLGDHAALDQVVEGLVERLHAILSAGFNGGGQFF